MFSRSLTLSDCRWSRILRVSSLSVPSQARFNPRIVSSKIRAGVRRWASGFYPVDSAHPLPQGFRLLGLCNSCQEVCLLLDLRFGYFSPNFCLNESHFLSYFGIFIATA